MRKALVILLVIGAIFAMYIGEQLSRLQVNFLFFTFITSVVIGVGTLVWFVIRVIINENRSHRLANQHYSQSLFMRDQPPANPNPYSQAPINLFIITANIFPPAPPAPQHSWDEQGSLTFQPPQVMGPVHPALPLPQPSKPLTLTDNSHQVANGQDVF